MNCDNIAIVLVEPREPGNIGAAARAMTNMGLSRLVLVRPADYLSAPAYRMALGGKTVLEGAEVYDDLPEALSRYEFVVGTTRREGDYRRERISPRSVAAEMEAVSAAGLSAVLFGREDRGLTNRELQFCHRLVMIPSAPRSQSLNLAQAVLIVAYELFLAGHGEMTPPLTPGDRRPAPLGQMEEMYAHMERALIEIDFLHEKDPARMMRAFRRIFARAGLDEREVRSLRGVFHQIEWYSRAGAPLPGKK